MRKHEKDELLKIVDAISKVHDVIGECLKRRETANAVALLAECQKSAAQLGELIEKMDRSATTTIESIEAYCEEAYQIAAHIESEENPRKIQKRLNKRIIGVRNSIFSDIRLRLEVVFLPYKASMWDSMESVWMAARDDPDCDAYVIPIPYYDRNPDMSFGQFHYEGGQFPSDVPVLHYERYDLAQRRPDIIFIHNAYDENNLVTSVDPQYYSVELKKYTQELFFVEYGLPIWVCRTPELYDSVSNSLYRMDVIAYYSKEYARNTLYSMRKLGGPVSTEVVGLGSPKFDKVLHSARSDYTLPEEWSRLITGRKTVLINSSIGAFLRDTGAYLDHLENVLAVFQEADGVVPWWRPHPLLRSTAQSMRPEFLMRYDSIVNKYRQTGIGIYDESADLHRAIQWTDAYYGDESSLVYLYCATGKPITISRQLDDSFLVDGAETFEQALNWRIYCMKTAPGANIAGDNVCVYWVVFWEDPQYCDFLRRYLDFVQHPEGYPQLQEYQRLQMELFYSFVSNADGTAGEKIYRYGKRKCIGGKG